MNHWWLRLALMFVLGGCMFHGPRSNLPFLSKELVIIAHRGGPNEFGPENSLQAIAGAAEEGFAIEFDVLLSQDEEVVIMHDKTLDRTTKGTGKVSAKNLDELQKLGVPTLAEGLDLIEGKVKLALEIKDPGDDKKIPLLARKVAKAIKERNLYDSVWVMSFHPMILEHLKKSDPKIYRAQLYGTFEDSDLVFYKKWLLKNLAFNKKADPDILSVEDSLVDADYVQKYHGLGYKILTWTVDEPARMGELIALGVDGIITNSPKLLKKIYLESKKNSLY